MSDRPGSKGEVYESENVSNHSPPVELAAAHEKHDLHHTQTVDTIHMDEAMKVIAAYDGEQTWTDMEEKKLRRRIDKKLLSILCITYGLQYYDKAMLAQAVSISTNPGLMNPRDHPYLTA
jgi:hypothetical protein